MKNKRSFFERLTGAVKLEEEEMDEPLLKSDDSKSKNSLIEKLEEEAELTVDVYNTPSEIIVKTMVPGVKPEDLDVSITRDSVSIRGERSEERTVSDEDYIHRELFWGTFSRTIPLPEEVSVDDAEATEKHGVLVLRLPKVDRHRQARLKVKGN